MTDNVIDLVWRNATELALDADMDLDSVASVVEGLQAAGIAPRQPGRYVFAEAYEASGTPHHARASLTVPADPSSATATLSVRYRLGPLGHGDAPMPAVTDLWRLAARIGDELKVRTRAAFAYSGETHTSFFALPTPAGSEAQGLYDEIRGVRLAKTDDGEAVYEVVIDRPDNDAIFGSVTFTIAERLGPGLPITLLTIAAEVVSYFIRPVGR